MASGYGLKGQAAIVTGSTSGIGQALAHALAAEGVGIVLNGFGDAAKIEADRAALAASAGVKVLYHGADMTKPAEIADMVAFANRELGRLDILVNNAGGAMPTPYLDTTPEALDEAFHFNVSASFELTKRATPHLLDSGRGSVINITSRMDRLTARQMVIYGTVKAALSHMTHLLAAELAPWARVNGIAPGVVETDGLQSVLKDEVRRRIVAATPLRRLSTVGDVANTARWLASPAAGYITGKVIEVDGGAAAPTFPDDTLDLQITVA
jgi:7-alpha-hydroxysteroid dehydrogenase